MRIERDGVLLREAMALQPRALLACLVLAQAPVRRDWLRGLFWPDVPEARAQLRLRAALARLRAALPGRIRADRQSVAFQALAGDDVDVWRLRSLLQVAAAPVGTPPEWLEGRDLLQRLGSGLAADLDDAATEEFRAWLVEQRTAWEALIAAHQARLGTTNRSVAAAGPLASRLGGKDPTERASSDGASAPVLDDQDWSRLWFGRHPVTESLLQRRMLDLARRGEYHAALDAYNRQAEALADHLGLSPDGATEAMRTRIVTAMARERRHNLDVKAAVDNESAGRRLPRQVPQHGGDVMRLADLLSDAERRWITLVAPPGPARATLAQQAALLAVDSLLDGVLWVPHRLGPEQAPLARRLAAAIDRLDGRRPAEADIGSYLAPLERLVVVDGPDDEAGAVDVLEQWVATAPTLRWLALCAEPLGLYFEQRFQPSA